MYYACFSYSVRFTHFVYPPLRGLKEKLLAAGWVKFQKLYTPKQVACLVEHLGEP